MINRVIQKRFALALVSLLFLGVVVSGCSTNSREKKGDMTKSDPISLGKYYYFDDILIPKELEYDPDKSFIYETPQFKTGSMVFSKWWLDVESLIEFFTYHMEKDNWKTLNSFRGKESFLTFSKPDKNCLIRIVDKWTGTVEVEIRVGPVGMKKM
jgi:hypothetical protein